MKLNGIYEVKIVETDINGNGICRIDNIVTFVFGALKDETVKIKIVLIDKRIAFGKLIEVISKSADRINPPCKYYDLCGGCNLLHTTFDNETFIKKKYLDDLFKLDVEVLKIDNFFNYRNKVKLHVIDGRVGYFNEKTHCLCKIDNCMLLDKNINSVIIDLENYVLNGINEIMIRSLNNEIMINITGDNVNDAIKGIKCDSLYINDIHVSGKEYLIDIVNGNKYSVYPLSFYQVNKEGMINIYNKAKEYISTGNNLIDLYCGTGTIGIWMKENFNNIIGIEINESSILNANINKELNNIYNIDFKLGDASLVKNYINNIDAIIVDPPRSGLSKSVIRALNECESKRIVYISCNPKTLKRDVDLLDKYVLKKISMCNMFPRTKHIECVCLLERK